MTAKRRGSNWVLNGTKTFCTNGHYADAIVVIAVTDRAANTHGLSAFIVEKDTKGFRPGKKENKLGLRASDTAEMIFEDCVIPAENLLGKEGDGFIDAMRVLDGGRISIAALSLGMAQGAYEAALNYSKERKQFGKAIGEFQAIQWKLADMATEIDAARLLTMRAASMKDAGMKTTLESSMAKLYASEVAVRCANEGVQIHGGYGFIKDYPAEKYYRDVKLCTIGEGTSEIQRLVIARQLLKDKRRAFSIGGHACGGGRRETRWPVWCVRLSDPRNRDRCPRPLLRSPGAPTRDRRPELRRGPQRFLASPSGVFFRSCLSLRLQRNHVHVLAMVSSHLSQGVRG
jgi:hypothetical protein